MALVSGIGGGIGGAWAETPNSVALPLSYKGSDAFPNLITVGVGGGAQGNVTFDVGSTGFYVLESAVGPDDVTSHCLAFPSTWKQASIDFSSQAKGANCSIGVFTFMDVSVVDGMP